METRESTAGPAAEEVGDLNELLRQLEAQRAGVFTSVEAGESGAPGEGDSSGCNGRSGGRGEGPGSGDGLNSEGIYQGVDDSTVGGGELVRHGVRRKAGSRSPPCDVPGRVDGGHDAKASFEKEKAGSAGGVDTAGSFVGREGILSREKGSGERQREAEKERMVISTSGLGTGGAAAKEPLNRWRSLPVRPSSGEGGGSGIRSARRVFDAGDDGRSPRDAASSSKVSSLRGGSGGALAGRGGLGGGVGGGGGLSTAGVAGSSAGGLGGSGGRALLEMR